MIDLPVTPNSLSLNGKNCMENSVENYSLDLGNEMVIKFSIHSEGILQILWQNTFEIFL